LCSREGIGVSFETAMQYFGIFVAYPAVAILALLIMASASAYWTASTRATLHMLMRDRAVLFANSGESLNGRMLRRLREIDKVAKNPSEDAFDPIGRDWAIAAAAGRPGDLYLIFSLIGRREEIAQNAVHSMARRCSNATSAKQVIRWSSLWYLAEYSSVIRAGVSDSTIPLVRRALGRAESPATKGSVVGLVTGLFVWLITRENFALSIGNGVLVGTFVGVLWTLVGTYRELAPDLYATPEPGSAPRKRVWTPLVLMIAFGPIIYYRPWEYMSRLTGPWVRWALTRMEQEPKVAAIVSLGLTGLFLAWKVSVVVRSGMSRGRPAAERLDDLAVVLFGVAIIAVLGMGIDFAVRAPVQMTSGGGVSAGPAGSAFDSLAMWRWLTVGLVLLSALVVLLAALIRTRKNLAVRMKQVHRYRVAGLRRKYRVPIPAYMALWAGLTFLSWILCVPVVYLVSPHFLESVSASSTFPPQLLVLLAPILVTGVAGWIHVNIVRRRRRDEDRELQVQYEAIQRRRAVNSGAEELSVLHSPKRY
jgi:hypothetical protein